MAPTTILTQKSFDEKLEELKADQGLFYGGIPTPWEFDGKMYHRHHFYIMEEIKYRGIEESPNTATDYFYDPGPENPDALPWPEVMWSDCPDRPPVLFQWVMKNAQGRLSRPDGFIETADRKHSIEIKHPAWQDEAWWRIVLGRDFKSFVFEGDPCSCVNPGPSRCEYDRQMDELDELPLEKATGAFKDLCASCKAEHPGQWVMRVEHSIDGASLRAIIAWLWMATRGNGNTMEHCGANGGIMIKDGLITVTGYLCACSC